MTDTELLELIDQIKSTMVSVATGGARIEEVNWVFGEQYDQVNAEVRRRGLANPFPYRDLWQWYGKWSSDLAGYARRRAYVSDLVANTIGALKNGHFGEVEPTGWARVDRTLDEARIALGRAQTEEQFQSVGLFCREALISCAQEVHDADRHPTLDGVSASPTDFKRRIEAYIAVELFGSAAEEARRHARTALDLSLRLQHQRTAIFRDAAICLEASASVVSIIAIVSGRRDP